MLKTMHHIVNPEIPIIIAISGASGAIYGITLLKILKQLNQKTILIISKAGIRTVQHELKLSKEEIYSLASVYYNNSDIGAKISSGSFLTKGIIIAPCSVKTLSGIANSYDDNLIVRATDVILKEQKKALLLFRETPLHKGHIKLMLKASEIGATIMPPVNAFYNFPKSIEDLVEYTLYRALDMFDIHIKTSRWGEEGEATL